MQSPGSDDTGAMTLERTALLLAAISLNFLEFFIPRIPLFPWLKPGLANSITVIWILKYGLAESILLSLLRIWTVGFYFGFSFLTLSLSLGGSTLAVLMMGLSWRVFGKRKLLGIIGVSIIGALFHNAGQLIMVYFLMARNLFLFYQLPFMTGAAIVFGALVGIVALFMLRVIDQTSIQEHPDFERKIVHHEISPGNLTAAAGIITYCIGILFIDIPWILAILAAGTTIAVQFIVKGSIKVLISPITKFWLLFIFIGALHLFFSFGTRIESVPFVTHEGVHAALTQWLRLWTWLQLSFALTHVKFHYALFSGLRKLFRGKEYALDAGVLAVELFPHIPDLVRKETIPLFKGLFRSPIHSFRRFFMVVYRDIESLIVSHLGSVVSEERDSKGESRRSQV
ncbi:MAG: hypothetical protein GF401_20860 [Chitinivibrionales bacterium]|nr:hypothetical protein [Chitinivibrionales bacterium]